MPHCSVVGGTLGLLSTILGQRVFMKNINRQRDGRPLRERNSRGFNIEEGKACFLQLNCNYKLIILLY